MYFNTADQIARQRALKKQRKALSNCIIIIVAIPLFFVFFTIYREPTMIWLYSNDILPDYGVMQFVEGRSRVNWDRHLVSGVVGGAIGLIGSIVAYPIVRIFVR